MEANNTIIMNTKEQWFGFYKSLRDILRDGASKYTGMEAFNEINTLLILVFLEDKLENFDIENIEMCKFRYMYDLFYTKIDKKIKDEKIKEPQLSQLMKVTKLELFKYLFDKRRNYEIQNKTENTISFKLKDEIDGDIYFKHHPSVFVQILKTSRLNRLFIRTKMNDNDNAVDISTITGFIEDHSDDVYTLIKKIADTFYIKDANGNLESILHNSDLNFDALGGAYEKFMTDDTMNSKNTGEFFTRRDLITFIVIQFGINENDIVYDSSVGTGGFLLECIRLVKNKLLEDLKAGIINQTQFQQKFDNFLKNNIHGNEIKPNLYKSLMLNILMNDPKGLCLENLLCIDSMLINEDDEDGGNKMKSLNFSTISTGNPPYGCSLDKTPNNVKIRSVDGEEIYDEESKENYFSPIMTGKNIIKNSSGQFVMHLIRCLKNNGKAGFIIDRGVLINGTDSKKSWNKSLRKFMIEKNRLTKIVLLPTGIFEHTNFATCVIFLTKGGKTSSVQFQELYFKDEDKGVGFKKFYEGNVWNITFEQLKNKDYSLDPKDFNIPLLEYQKRGKSEIVVEMKTEMSSIPIEWKKIKQVCKIEYGKRITKSKNSVKQTEQFQYPVYGGGDISFYTNIFNRPIEGESDTLVMSRFGVSNNCIRFVKGNFFLLDSGMSIHTDLNKKYIVYILKILQDVIFSNADGPGQKNMKIEKMLDINIPIPSLENQQKIVDKLDTYFGEDSIHKFDLNTIMKYENGNRMLNYIFNEEWTKFLDCVEKAQRIDDLKSIKTNQLLTELSNRTIAKFNPDTKSKTKTNIEEYVIETFLKKEFDYISKDMEFESKKINDLFTIKSGDLLNINKFVKGEYPVIGGGKVFKGYHNQYNTDSNNIFVARVGDAGYISYIETKCFCTDNCLKLTSITSNINKYIYYCLKIIQEDIKKLCGKNGQPNINQTNVKSIVILIPSIANQQIIVNYLDEKMEYHKNYWNTISQMFSNYSFSTYDDSNILEESDDLEGNEITVV